MRAPRKPPQERVSEDWPRSEKGRLFFQGRAWLFVALPPDPEDGEYARWRLWVKKPRAADGYRARGRYPSFEALQQTVAELLPLLPV